MGKKIKLWKISRFWRSLIRDRTRLSALNLRGKLIFMFALISLIPTVSLVFVSLLIISQSIERWGDISSELRKLRILPMGENAMEIAADPSFMEALEKGEDLSEMDFDLSENYILNIYNTDGARVFSTNDEPIPGVRLDSLEEAGLPPVDEFRPWEPVVPREIRVKNRELALSAVMSQSAEDGRILGVVVVGEVTPSVPADIGMGTVIIVLTMVGVLIFVIALWISYLIAREITNPIRELVDATQEVASGNLEYHVSTTARDEVGMLADSFNQMTIRLRLYAEELRRAEKAAAWREVAQKLAHEIKNPLTPIQLSAERLRRRYHSKREGYEQVLDECTHTIIGEVERLQRLLEEFSRFARMPSANPVPSDVNGILEKALRLYGEFPEDLEVRTEYAENLPVVSVDPEQMERAFFNIVKNAVEAMHDGGRLTVSTRLVSRSADISSASSGETGEAYIEVQFADTGPGISTEYMAKLFTPHFSTKKGSAGLGLAIVKRIITDHDGDVMVRSDEEGATFIIRIPVLEGAGNGQYDHAGGG